jgi:hypothetical protein
VRGRLIGGAGRQREPSGQQSGAGESERVRQCGDGALTGGPGSIVLASSVLNLVLNRFNNIQMVQMKFEFLQIWAGLKDTFLHSKNLK